MYRGEYAADPHRDGFVRTTAATALTVLRNEGPLALAVKAACLLDLPADRLLDRYRWQFDADGGFDLPTVWVRPADVTADKTVPFPVRGPDATVGVGTGDWDAYTRPFEETLVYRSLRQRFVDGRDWEDTPKYRRSVAEVDRGGATWNGCRTRDDVDARCSEIDRLYRTIRDDGYQPQRALHADADDTDIENYARRVGPWLVPDELRVAVDRDGALVRCACARHRLSIAKLLGIDRIPAVVQLVHTDFEPAVTERFDRLDGRELYRRVDE